MVEYDREHGSGDMDVTAPLGAPGRAGRRSGSSQHGAALLGPGLRVAVAGADTDPGPVGQRRCRACDVTGGHAGTQGLDASLPRLERKLRTRAWWWGCAGSSTRQVARHLLDGRQPATGRPWVGVVTELRQNVAGGT